MQAMMMDDLALAPCKPSRLRLRVSSGLQGMMTGDSNL